MGDEIGTRIRRLADRCTCRVNGMSSPTPSDIMDALVGVMGGMTEDELCDLGSESVETLRALGCEADAIALDFVLWGDPRKKNEWVRRETGRIAQLLAGATPAGEPHGSLGTWRIGRPAGK